MKIRTILVGLFAMICGVSAAVGVIHVRNSGAAKSPVEEDTVLVISANMTIKRGTILSEEMLAYRRWPKKIVTPSLIQDKEDVLGKMTKSSLVKSEPIMREKIGKNARLSGLLAENMRAYTILTPNDASLVAGFIEPGDKVDVLYTDQRSGRNDLTGGGSTTPLLQNIEVLAVGQDVEADDNNTKTTKDMRSVTLMLTLDNAAKLSLAQETGTLHLALRGDYQTTAPANAVTMNDIRFLSLPAVVEEKPAEPVAVEPILEPPVIEVTPPPRPAVIHIRTLRGVASSKIIMNAETDSRKRYRPEQKLVVER